MSLRADHTVAIHNNFIIGQQGLSVNEAKLLRLAIMQVLYDQKDFKTYKISIKELSSVLGISGKSLYRDIDKICNNLIKSSICIGKNPNKKWLKLSYVSLAHYDGAGTITIKLNEELKPYILNLRKLYTSYSFEQIQNMKSAYSIRIFELIRMKMLNGDKNIPKGGIYVKLMVDELRYCCDISQEKYDKINDLKRFVIDKALKEINDKTSYHVDYFIPIKKERKIIGYELIIRSRFDPSIW